MRKHRWLRLFLLILPAAPWCPTTLAVRDTTTTAIEQKAAPLVEDTADKEPKATPKSKRKIPESSDSSEPEEDKG